MLQTYREQIANYIFPEGLTERRRLTREIDIDPLTGLANRRAFDLAKDTAENDPDTVFIVFDMNDFGKLNKVYGHAEGDKALREVADVMRRAGGDRLFRYAGDEFVVLADIDRARAIRDRIEAAFYINRGELVVTVSGSIGQTFNEADSILQARKAERKARLAV